MAFVTNLFAAAGHLDTPTADYLGHEAAFPWDGNTGLTRHQNHAALTGMAFRSPTVGTVMLTGDDAIYIVHSPSEYTPDPMNPSPFDDELVLLIGNDLSSVSSIVVADATAIHTADFHVFDVPYITGATGQVATAPCTNTRLKWLECRTLQVFAGRNSACCRLRVMLPLSPMP
jgi:hypothetical protein